MGVHILGQRLRLRFYNGGWSTFRDVAYGNGFIYAAFGQKGWKGILQWIDDLIV